jgi:hypothetical protein
MNGVRVLIAVSSRYTPSVWHREHAEKHLVRRCNWGREAPRKLRKLSRGRSRTLVAIVCLQTSFVIKGGVEDG